jgi:hypothetical protein
VQVAISVLEATHTSNEIQMQFSIGEFDSRLQVWSEFVAHRLSSEKVRN